MTREINSTFEYEGKTYKVVEDKPKRTDRELVHFELVTNNKE